MKWKVFVRGGYFVVGDIEMTHVKSRAISDVVYREKSQTLYVFFTDHSSFAYHGVPKYVYDELLSAESKGVYFNLNIRNAYTYDEY